MVLKNMNFSICTGTSMHAVCVQDRDPEYVFNFPFPEINLTQDAVSFRDVFFNYPEGPTLFRNLSFGIALETRAAIVGPNGATQRPAIPAGLFYLTP